MNLSKTTKYALRILIFMANDEQQAFNANYLYDKLEIPKMYLRRLLTTLSKGGFITSSRGRNGGFIFAKTLDSIFLTDIIDLIEGPSMMDRCFLGVTDCSMEGNCVMHNRWENIRNLMYSTLSTTSLKDLVNKEIF